jgi:spore maturation protein CgeB
MRIFLVLHPSGNLAVPGSMTWYKNLYEPLVELGHDVFFLRLDQLAAQWNTKFRSAKFKSRLSHTLLTVLRAEHAKKVFNLFFSYFTDLDIEAQVVAEIKKLNIPAVNYSCNNTHQFHLVEKISPHYDFNLHAEKSAADKFKKINAKPVWFQMAANPAYYHPLDLHRDYPVTFTGSNYARRARYIFYLLEHGAAVDCFGPNWLAANRMKKIKWQIKRTGNLVAARVSFSASRRHSSALQVQEFDIQQNLRRLYHKNLHSPVAEDDLVKLFNRSEINLGFLEVFAQDNKNSPVIQKHLHLREFEIPMSGGLYITNYSDELAEHYEPDKEVIVFRDEQELLDKVRYFLTHDTEARQVRLAGLHRALRCHTCQRRFTDLFQQLHLD